MNHERLMMIQSANRAEKPSRDRDGNSDSHSRQRNRHEEHGRRSHRHHHHHRTREDARRSPRHAENGRSKGFPSLRVKLPPLSFPAFENYQIQEAPDFDTSCDEQADDNVKVRAQDPATAIDRLRGEDGGIDLGLNRTDLGRIETESDYHDKKRRKMINYDTHAKQPNATASTSAMESSKKLADDNSQISYTFGDRGSTWRMMKLRKLDPGNGRRPSKAMIFEQYATLWDYDLACMERDELEARKRKPKNEWSYTPPESFMKKRRSHVMANRQVMKELLKAKEEEEKMKESGDIDSGNEEASVLYMKKHGGIKMSKSKRLRNELKLAHLTALDQAESEDYLTPISREQIESLTNSP